MPVTIDWFNEKKNMSHIKFIKPWTWDEFYGVYESGRKMIDTVEHRVHIIMDLSKVAACCPPAP